MPAPAAVEESRLVDDVRAVGHGPLGGGRGEPQPLAGLCLVPIRVDGYDAPTLVAALGQVPRLVLEPTTANDLEFGIHPVRTLHEPAQRRPLERGQMLAGK